MATAKPKTKVKKPAAKKPAAKKPAVKKPAAKKPVAKKAAVKKPAVKKTAAKKIEVKKPAVEKKTTPPSSLKHSDVLDSNVKSRNLFDAFAQGKLPFAHGYIISSFFSVNTAYSIYEIVSYAGVKEIFVTDTGLQFVTGGKKLFILVEPGSYEKKHEEPVSRAEGEKIPKRYNELEIITASNQTKIMVAKEPNETYGSFTVLKPMGANFAVVFYQLPDVYTSIASFFEKSLNIQRKVPQADAKKAAHLITSIVEKSMGFKGEFE
ncbi:MAG: hypothetical protein LBH44_00770 [Treponema sp.]|nr:hypothetical protein [Treponema sp.]